MTDWTFNDALWICNERSCYVHGYNQALRYDTWMNIYVDEKEI
jgi:hypothetical protein